MTVELVTAEYVDICNAMQAREIQQEALKALFAKYQVALMADEMLAHPNCTDWSLRHAWTEAKEWAALRHSCCDDWDMHHHAQLNSAQLLGLHWEANLSVSHSTAQHAKQESGVCHDMQILFGCMMIFLQSVLFGKGSGF